jgi:hypothetical protein
MQQFRLIKRSRKPTEKEDVAEEKTKTRELKEQKKRKKKTTMTTTTGRRGVSIPDLCLPIETRER